MSKEVEEEPHKRQEMWKESAGPRTSCSTPMLHDMLKQPANRLLLHQPHRPELPVFASDFLRGADLQVTSDSQLYQASSDLGRRCRVILLT